MAENREKVWIVKGMGDLPFDRIEIGQPSIYNTGIDYFGPILTKQLRRTRSTMGKTKQWGALERVWDLATDSFILALRRFC